jgi:uncharacterized protein YlzI (FlbEa/FlbD family)
VWLRCLALATVLLIELHGADGQRFFLNTADISQVREPSAKDLNRHFAPGARCVVVMQSGAFLAVRESCEEVLTMANVP